MEKFKKLFPLTAKFSKDGNSLAIGLLIYIGIWLIGPWIIGTALGAILLLLGVVTFGLTTGLAVPVAIIAECLVIAYAIAGVVLLVLDYSKANKVEETNNAE